MPAGPIRILARRRPVALPRGAAHAAEHPGATSRWWARPATARRPSGWPSARIPTVVLMDLRMPVLDGVAATRRLRSSRPQVRVIVLTTFDDDETVFDGPARRAPSATCSRTPPPTGSSRPSAPRPAASHSCSRRSPPRWWPSSSAWRPAAPARAGPGRAALRARAGDPAPAGRRRQQPGDRRRAGHRRGHGQEPRDQHPGQAGRDRPHPGRPEGPRAAADLGRALRSGPARTRPRSLLVTPQIVTGHAFWCDRSHSLNMPPRRDLRHMSLAAPHARMQAVQGEASWRASAAHGSRIHQVHQ